MAFPSTFTDLQTAVYNIARLDSSADTQKVKDWINEAYYQAVLETECKQGVATMDLTANTSSYTLDAAVARIKAMYVTPTSAAQSGPLIPVSVEEILQRRKGSTSSNTSSGSVTHYALLGSSQFEVWPTPATADTITIYYVAFPTALSGSSDTPSAIDEPYATRLLTYGAAAEAAAFKKDPLEQEFRAIYEDWLRRLRAHLNRKRGAGTLQFRVPAASNYPPHDPSTDIGL